MSETKVLLTRPVNISQNYAKTIRVGGTLQSYQVINQTGSSTGSQILFQNLALPSLGNSVISKNMRVRYVVQLTANADPPVFNPLNPLTDAPPQMVFRQFPLSSITDTLTVSINNVSSTINLRNVLPGYARTIDKFYLMSKASEAPSQCDDNSILSGDALMAAGGAPLSNQVFSTYYNGSHVNRGSFEPIGYDAGTHTFTYEICEPVMCSPLALDDTSPYLANCNTLNIQYNYSNLTDMVLTAGQGALPAGFAVAITNAFIEYDVISLDNRIVSIPRVYMTPYFNTQYFNKTDASGLINTNSNPQPITFTSDSIRLSSMPELLIIFAGPSQSSRSAHPGQLADAFLQWGDSGAAGIGAVNLSLNNRQGLLQSCSTKELYRISVKNGYCYSYTTWLKCGGPIVLSPVSDLGLDISAGDVLPGMAGNVILQVTTRHNNSNWYFAGLQQAVGTNINNVQFQQTIVCVYKGVAEISPDSMALNLGILSASEVNMALSKAPASGESIPENLVDAYEGGHLFGQKAPLLGSVARGAGAVVSGGRMGMRK